MTRPTLQHVTALLLVTLASAVLAAQNDQQPTDFISLPHGTTNIAVYAARQTYDGLWNNGTQAQRVEGSTSVMVLRANRHFSVGEEGKYTIAPLIALSASDTKVNAPSAPLLAGDTAGVGDLRLGTAFWFYSDPVNREYVMATVIVSLPTGAYVPTQAVNTGENRTKTVLSLGWMQPLGSAWVLDLVPEVAFFGDNKAYRGNNRLSQDTAYAMSTTLRYKATQAFHLYGTGQVNRGGATQRNGIAMTGTPDNTRLALGALLFSTDKSQIQLRYAKDVQIDNGLRNTGEIMLRWSTVF